MIRSHTISPCPFSYQGKQINYFLWCRQHKVTWPSAVKLWNVSFGSQLFYHRATPQSCLQLHFPACKRHWAAMFHSARAAVWGSQHWTMSTANARSHPPHPSLGTASFFLSMRHADWYPCDPVIQLHLQQLWAFLWMYFPHTHRQTHGQSQTNPPDLLSSPGKTTNKPLISSYCHTVPSVRRLPG